VFKSLCIGKDDAILYHYTSLLKRRREKMYFVLSPRFRKDILLIRKGTKNGNRIMKNQTYYHKRD